MISILTQLNIPFHKATRLKFWESILQLDYATVPLLTQWLAKINYRLSILKKVLKYTNKRTAKMLTDSIIISVFKYGAPLLTNCNYRVLQKMNTLLLKCSRPILGFNSYKWTTTKIMKTLNWTTFQHGYDGNFDFYS